MNHVILSNYNVHNIGP